MGKEYKLVELTEEERKNKTYIEMADFSCSKCVAYNDYDLCDSMPPCSEDFNYFIEVKTDDK